MQNRGFSAALVFWVGAITGAHADDPGLVAVEVARPQPQQSAPDLVLTGEIQARVQSNISFRADGKIVSRKVEVGAHVTSDEVLATLESSQQQAEVARNQAGLLSAQALLEQARVDFQRQERLLENGYTTRASFDQAREKLDTTQAQVRAAEAALEIATEQLSYTNLRVDRPGVIVARNAEAGQVVQSGGTVFVLAEDGPRDAVFNVADSLVNGPVLGRTIDILLQSDPHVQATGVIREVSPIIDSRTGAVTVTIGLEECPQQMTLGATVLGRKRGEGDKALALPWSALSEWNGQPAVWVLTDKSEVMPQVIGLLRYTARAIVVAKGLNEGQRVVVAGTQFLYPGQKVAVSDGAARELP